MMTCCTFTLSNKLDLNQAILVSHNEHGPNKLKCHSTLGCCVVSVKNPSFKHHDHFHNTLFSLYHSTIS